MQMLFSLFKIPTVSHRNIGKMQKHSRVHAANKLDITNRFTAVSLFSKRLDSKLVIGIKTEYTE